MRITDFVSGRTSFDNDFIAEIIKKTIWEEQAQNLTFWGGDVKSLQEEPRKEEDKANRFKPLE